MLRFDYLRIALYQFVVLAPLLLSPPCAVAGPDTVSVLPTVTLYSQNTADTKSDAEVTKMLTNSELTPLDLNAHPKFRSIAEKIKDLVIRLTHDGDRSPIHFVLLDDMVPNAFLDRKSNTLMVNLGLLNFIQSDDELAFVLGHELDHGISELQAEIDGHAGSAPGRTHKHSTSADGFLNCALQRTIESEVDVKSMRRMIHVGLNPNASLHFMRRIAFENSGQFFRSSTRTKS